MLNAQPFELIAAPFTVWVAPIGTAFPAVDAEPDSSDWTLVGTSGPLNYTEDGVTVEHSQSLTFWRSLGDNGPRKVFRTQEDLKIGLTLADITLEQYALALNNNPVSPTAPGVGVAGSKKVGLSRGDTIDTRALLVRGPSPYVADGNLQYEVPVAVQTGNPSIVFRRNEPAGLKLEWTALADPAAASADERFGVIRALTAPAT